MAKNAFVKSQTTSNHLNLIELNAELKFEWLRAVSKW